MSSATYAVHDVGPALERDTLKDGQHGESEVVEVCDAEVGTFPVEVADLVQVRHARESLAARPRHLADHLVCTEHADTA